MYSTQPGETPSQATKRENEQFRNGENADREFVGLVKDLPDKDALTLIHRLRAGQALEEILSEFRTGQILVQMAVRPETRLRYDLPYQAEIPQRYLVNSAYMGSLIYEVAGLYGPDQEQTSPQRNNSPAFQTPDHENMYLKPFHAAKVIDPRLTDVKPSLWTNVTRDDAFMRELLDDFFRCEYFFTMIFHKDYFLEDMAAQRSEFCSSLLVNIVLAYCCVSHPFSFCLKPC